MADASVPRHHGNKKRAGSEKRASNEQSDSIPASSPASSVSIAAVALVFVGGTVGTAARAGIALVSAPVAPLPVATMAINIVGAFLLGLLLESLVLRSCMVHAGSGRQRSGDLRLLLGTGVLGGFTTYSALAVDAAQLAVRSHPLVLVGYAVGTILIGAIATTGGILTASAIFGPGTPFFSPRPDSPPQSPSAASDTPLPPPAVTP